MLDLIDLAQMEGSVLAESALRLARLAEDRSTPAAGIAAAVKNLQPLKDRLEWRAREVTR